jgi:hypothetical protein
LEQVEKLNHKPFKLKGFDKDRIATVSDWDGGALATLAGDCHAGLSLRADAKDACSGRFAKDSSHLELVTAFDSKNITFTDVEAADATKVPASILFPNDPKRRLEVWWSDRTHRSDIHLIVIGGHSTWTAPDWLERAAPKEGLPVAQAPRPMPQ